MDAAQLKMHDSIRHSAAGTGRVELDLLALPWIANRASRLATNASSDVFYQLSCAGLYRGSKAACRSQGLVELFVVLFLPRRANTGRPLRGGHFSQRLNLSNGCGLRSSRMM